MAIPYQSQTVVWGCFVPIALVSLIITIIALTHFRAIYRSLDLLLISMACGLLVGVVILFPIFMAVVINRIGWSEELCKVFTWCFITTKTIGIISLVVISIDGVLMLRVPGRYRIYGIIRSKTIHFCIVGFWLVAIIVGIVPILLWNSKKFTADWTVAGAVPTTNQCLFLPHELSDSFAIFLAITEFAGITVSIICIIDAYFYLRHVKSSYEFDAEYTSSEKAPPLLKKEERGKRNHELLKALDFTHSAKDSWAVSFVVVLVSYLLCHIPFMVSEINQLLTLNSA